MYQFYKNYVPYSVPPVPQYIGANSVTFNSVYAHQKKPNLCWAACIEMVSRYYGISVSQNEFAKQYCGVDFWGNAKDCPASVDVITKSLNWCYKTHCIGTTAFYGSPDLNYLFALIESGQPIIVAYSQGEYMPGHAVLITGLSYIKKGFTNEIQSIVVRDPDPNKYNRLLNGRKEYSNPQAFLGKIYAWWYPTVSKYDCPVCVH